MRRSIPALASAALLILGSCRENDLGTGANTVDREFSKPAHDVWKASVKSAETMDLTISSDRHDEFGGELVASRANCNEVHVWVKSLGEKRSQVSVRVEPGDRALATLLQERIAEKLGLGEARSGFLGGNGLEGTYATELSLAMLAARRAFRTLEVTLTGEETHAEWARLDGRRSDSTPVRIRMEQIDPARVKVSFISGNEKTEDNKDFARRLKEEYEAALRLRSD
jgi:hypothetical protein